MDNIDLIESEAMDDIDLIESEATDRNNQIEQGDGSDACHELGFKAQTYLL